MYDTIIKIIIMIIFRYSKSLAIAIFIFIWYSKIIEIMILILKSLEIAKCSEIQTSKCTL